MPDELHRVDDSGLLRQLIRRLAFMQFQPDDLLALQDRKGLVDGQYLDAAVVDGQQAIAGLDGTRSMGHRARQNGTDGQASVASPLYFGII
jgi:hypothetical protein